MQTEEQVAYLQRVSVSIQACLRFPWRSDKYYEWSFCAEHPSNNKYCVYYYNVCHIQSIMTIVHLSNSNFFNWRRWLLPNNWMPNFPFIVLHLISLDGQNKYIYTQKRYKIGSSHDSSTLGLGKNIDIAIPINSFSMKSENISERIASIWRMWDVSGWFHSQEYLQFSWAFRLRHRRLLGNFLKWIIATNWTENFQVFSHESMYKDRATHIDQKFSIVSNDNERLFRGYGGKEIHIWLSAERDKCWMFYFSSNPTAQDVNKLHAMRALLCLLKLIWNCAM